MFDFPIVLKPLINACKLRALATTATTSQVLPPLPGEKLREFLIGESQKMKTIVEKAKIPIE